MSNTDQNTASEIAVLRAEVAALRIDISDLVQAWKTASGMVVVVKWGATFGATVGTGWLAFKTIFHH